MKKESLVHFKALLEADYMVNRVDIENDTIKINLVSGENLIFNVEGYRELYVMFWISQVFEKRGEFK